MLTKRLSAEAPRNVGIDLLRGLAIVLVVVHHLGLRFPLKHTLLADYFPSRLNAAINYNGYEAVFLFFVISGFLITQLLLQRYGDVRHLDLKAFYIRRAARIIPCLLLIVAVLSALHGLQVPFYTIEESQQSLSAAIASAFGMYLNWYEGHYGYLPGGWDVLWSLSIEETFYVFFPLLCLTLRPRWLFIGVLIALFISLPFTRAALEHNEIWQEKAYLPGMSALALGVLTALLARQGLQWTTSLRQRMTSTLFIVGTILLVCSMYYGGVMWQLIRDFYMWPLVLGSAMLVLACHWRAHDRGLRLLPGFGWLARMGQLSYEIYLVHMFVVFAIVHYAPQLSSDKTWYFLWYFPAVLGSWWLGNVLAKYFSLPIENAIKQRYLFNRHPASDDTAVLTPP